MTRYLEVGKALARRVRSGELPAGAELPTVRECAGDFGATATTITRAYHYLAEGGVITLGDRRRASVATRGAMAAARLLESDDVFRLAGSDDPALHLLLDHVRSGVTNVGARGSFWALRQLSRGEADGAAIHLRHRSGVYNAPFALALLDGQDPHLIRLWGREQGFLVPPGNPMGIRTAVDVVDLRVARREEGAGTRVLLDQLVIEAEVSPSSIVGPEFHSHLETGLSIAAGIADVALGLRSAAEELALEFVPVVLESYDLILPGAALPAAQPLVAALADDTVRSAITDLGGYDLTHTGEVDALTG